MSTKRNRVTRKYQRGGVVEYADVANQLMKPGFVVIDGEKFLELRDGRIAHVPPPVVSFRIVNGRVVHQLEVRR